MEQKNNAMQMLDLIDRPAFCVKDGIIIRVNQAAQQRQISCNIAIAELQPANLPSLRDNTIEALNTTLTVAGSTYNTTVIPMDGFEVFILNVENTPSQLQAMALAAQHLRAPLGNVMAVMESLFHSDMLKNDQAAQQHAREANQGLYQLHRIICEMSDAYQYDAVSKPRLETVEMRSFFFELLEKAKTLLANIPVTVNYQGLDDLVFTQADPEMLTRAIYNLLSNAAKFSGKNSTIEAKLTRRDNMLQFTLQDDGDGIPATMYSTLFCRYLREPGIEDGTHGLGLGMHLVRSVAAAHGGTVLIDHPEGKGCRITLTLSIVQSNTSDVRSKIVSLVDYAGGRDHALLELCEVLPSALYDSSAF